MGKKSTSECKSLWGENGGTEVGTQDREIWRKAFERNVRKKFQDQTVEEATVEQMKKWTDEVARQRKEQRWPPKLTMSVLAQSRSSCASTAPGIPKCNRGLELALI